jgi:thiol-disulfide isomerase/thioredoxin
MADVIEGSRETPVIVDFWAPWCGPCKTLTPMLEAAVTAAKGKVRLIKIERRQGTAPCAGAAGPAVAIHPHGRRVLRQGSPWTCSRAQSRKANLTSS